MRSKFENLFSTQTQQISPLCNFVGCPYQPTNFLNDKKVKKFQGQFFELQNFPEITVLTSAAVSTCSYTSHFGARHSHTHRVQSTLSLPEL
jgi:hypothetical protein